MAETGTTTTNQRRGSLGIKPPKDYAVGDNQKRITSPAWAKPDVINRIHDKKGNFGVGDISITTPDQLNTPLGTIDGLPTIGVTLPAWARRAGSEFTQSLRDNPMRAGIRIPETIKGPFGISFSPAFAGQYDFNLNPFYSPSNQGVLAPSTPDNQRKQDMRIGIRGQRATTPYPGMTDPLGDGGGSNGFGSGYGGNWRGGGGGGGYSDYASNYLPAWYLNLVNWNIR